MNTVVFYNEYGAEVHRTYGCLPPPKGAEIRLPDERELIVRSIDLCFADDPSGVYHLHCETHFDPRDEVTT